MISAIPTIRNSIARFHPGGMIGRSMLMRVHQVMRPREAMAIVATDTPIRDVLQLLKTEKYPIPAFIEYEHAGTADPVSEVKKAYEICKRALA